MLNFVLRVGRSSKLSTFVPLRFVNNTAPILGNNHDIGQLEYITSIVSNTETRNVEWSNIKSKTLSTHGSVNEKNIDAIFLKIMVNNKRFDIALSYIDHLMSTNNNELNLGSTNGLMILYYELGKSNKLTDEQKSQILDIYNDLYKKYKILDYTTSEKLLHVLCVINEWKKALKVLDDISYSSKPSHSAYSSIIATLFNVDKKAEALKLIKTSLNANRHLQVIAYDAWINYIFRKFKSNATKLKHMENICMHIVNNTVILDQVSAQKLKETYEQLNWNAEYTKIRKADGQCRCCQKSLDCLTLNNEEFTKLQHNIKEKLIVGSDLFLKTSPQELDRFLDFIKKTASYDVVVDALNVAFIGGKGQMERVRLLRDVVNYFVKSNKKVFLLGRKHMLKWPKNYMAEIMRKTTSFFTDDLSQDDPYFITAAILNGSHTDFVSKDLLRGHKFLLQDEELRRIFRRWQWQHQWMVFVSRGRRLIIQAPLQFTPCAQNNDGTWHFPYEAEEVINKAQINDGTPDLSNWLCLRPKKT